MARGGHRLTAIAVKAAAKRGYLSDGNGLYLRVAAGGSKQWVVRYRAAGKLREFGLGSATIVTLASARTRAVEAQRQRQSDIDPIDAARAGKLVSATAKTFRQVAGLYIDAHKAGWKNAKHAAQWNATLEAHAYPAIGHLPVAGVETEHVVSILSKIWATVPETAGRTRGRIEAILDYAKARGWRDGPNPALWRGHLDMLLPARGKVAKVEHHAALAYSELPAFMSLLRQQTGASALALEFAILTAGRTSEILNAVWREIDLAAALWVVPAGRMKSGREHRVPLSQPALDVVANAAKLWGTDPGKPIFHGQRPGKSLSNMAFLMLLRRMGRPELTAHGFRSTFRDWAGNETETSREVAEAALAHVVGNKAEAAYRRGDALDKRRALMTVWADYCGGNL